MSEIPTEVAWAIVAVAFVALTIFFLITRPWDNDDEEQ